MLDLWAVPYEANRLPKTAAIVRQQSRALQNPNDELFAP